MNKCPSWLPTVAFGVVGMEMETVAAMRAWVKTGAVPGDVAR